MVKYKSRHNKILPMCKEDVKFWELLKRRNSKKTETESRDIFRNSPI